MGNFIKLHNLWKEVEPYSTPLQFFGGGSVVGGGFFGYFSPMAHIIGWPLAVAVGAALCLLIVLIFIAIFDRLKPKNKIQIVTNPQTEITFQRDGSSVSLVGSNLKNIRIYSSVYHTKNTSWDIALVFHYPIHITSMRIYGIDGSKPQHYEIKDRYDIFTRFILEGVPQNKFRITLNEKIDT